MQPEVEMETPPMTRSGRPQSLLPPLRLLLLLLLLLAAVSRQQVVMLAVVLAAALPTRGGPDQWQPGRP